MGLWVDNKWCWDLKWVSDIEGNLEVERVELMRVISFFGSREERFLAVD